MKQVRPILQSSGRVLVQHLCAHSSALPAPSRGWLQSHLKEPPSHRLLCNGTKTVWETMRCHGINWENVPTGHPGRYLYASSQLNAISLSHLLVEMQAGSIIYSVTATGMVTGMSSLLSITKMNWTNWTDWYFWMRKPKSVVSCKEHCSYITDARRECAVVPVLLGTVQLLLPEWPQCLQKLTRHGACYWKL